MDWIMIKLYYLVGVAMDGIMLQAILSSGGSYGLDNT